jgi:PAS domain S-box-containing protein
MLRGLLLGGWLCSVKLFNVSCLHLYICHHHSPDSSNQNSDFGQQLEVGQVTPHSVDPTFADPVADAAEQLRQGGNNLPYSGDLSNEFANVQTMIARQQQQQMKQAPQQPPAVVKAAAPLPAYMQLKQVQAIPPQNGNVRPLVPNGMNLPQAKRSRVDTGAPKVGLNPMPSYAGKSSVGASNVIYPRSYTTAAPSALVAAKAAADRSKGQAQIDRRRERNRILARRTRLRKKFFFESLQKDVADLQHENAALKSIVRSRLKPEDAHAILSTCNANEKLPSIIHDGEMNEGGGLEGEKALKHLDKEDFNLIQSIQNSQQCFIITDPSLHDNPIVYASDDFFELTGYSQEEVLGRNCRFLQGTKTSPEKVAAIRKAVSVGEDCNVTLVNYTSSGKPFWNSLFIAALRDAENNIVNFIGVIVKVAGPEPGDPEYGKILS